MRGLMPWALALLAVAIAGGSYWWLVEDAGVPSDAHFVLDMAQVRRLAESTPGDKPTQIRYEHVATFRFFTGMVVTGDGWSAAALPVNSYQVVFPDHTAIIDAALARDQAPPPFITTGFDNAAYQRVERGLDQASLIVVTHEHVDHIGGIAASPHLAALLPALRLTDAQIAHPERMKPALLAPANMKTYTPLHYDRYAAVAPGMVLIAAPGHSPGEQMVYVKLGDGRQLLLVGDVVWRQRNLDVQRERPRWVTALLIREDRKQVFGEIEALHQLMLSDPAVQIVPGHDGEAIARLVAAGLLEKGFLLKSKPAAAT